MGWETLHLPFLRPCHSRPWPRGQPRRGTRRARPTRPAPSDAEWGCNARIRAVGSACGPPPVRPGGNCIKIGLPGKVIPSKRKGLRDVIFSLKIVSDKWFSGKTYFYTIHPRVLKMYRSDALLTNSFQKGSSALTSTEVMGGAFLLRCSTHLATMPISSIWDFIVFPICKNGRPTLPLKTSLNFQVWGTYFEKL